MKQKLLDHSWYYKSPIDFEHKKWVLFAYLQNVDEAFSKRIFSPWLLRTEKITEDMIISLDYIKEFKKGSITKSILFSFEGIASMEKKPDSLEEIDIIEEILEFSIPLLKERIKEGKKLHYEYPTILYDE